MKIKVAIADDNRIQREGLKETLIKKNIETIFCGNITEITPAYMMEAQIILCQIDSFSSPRTAIQKIKSTNKNVKIVLIDKDSTVQRALQFIHLGVNGYVSNLFTVDNLGIVFHYVLKEKLFIDPSLTLTLFSKLSDFKEYMLSLNTEQRLSEEENKVMDLLIEGYTDREIAKQLIMSKRTVETYRQDLFKKIGGTNNLSLILYRLHQKFIVG